MAPSQNCVDLIKRFEGFRVDSYIDPVGIWTIGYGSIMYPDGLKVKEGEKITLDGAEKLLMWEIKNNTMHFQRLIESKSSGFMHEFLLQFRDGRV